MGAYTRPYMEHGNLLYQERRRSICLAPCRGCTCAPQKAIDRIDEPERSAAQSLRICWLSSKDKRLAAGEAVQPRRAVGAGALHLLRRLDQLQRLYPLAEVTLVQRPVQDRLVGFLELAEGEALG